MAGHPGETLRTRFLAPLGLSASALADGLGVDRSTVSRLLRGKQPITPEMAARLGAFFGVPACWWLLMQAEHDATVVSDRPDLVRDVRPWDPDPDVLLTPTGVIHLDEPAAEPAPVKGLRVVHYENGAVGLTSDEP